MPKLIIRNLLLCTRLPFAADSFIGLGIAFIVDIIVTSLFSLITLVFTAIYIGVTMIIASCVDDLQAISNHLNKNIRKRIAIKSNLIQVVRLYLQCYRCLSYNIWNFYRRDPRNFHGKTLKNDFCMNFVNLNYFRLMMMIESIINMPIFVQLSSFAFQFAATLFHFEDVSWFLRISPSSIDFYNEGFHGRLIAFSTYSLHLILISYNRF